MEENNLQVQDGFTRQPAKASALQMAVNRQAQEVQGAIFMAKQFPRDEWQAQERIKRTCQRLNLAEQAIYTYPRGGQTVSGPSIRLAETIAQQWGNIDFGIIELTNESGKSEIMAYAWDLETNTRVTKVFSVAHKRDTKKGSYDLTDSRDIYEATANFGARRVRACILGVIPSDVVDLAVKECKATLMAQDKAPIEERIKNLLASFKKDFKITKEQLEEFAGLNLAEFGKEEVYELVGVYKSIKDGQSSLEDYFGKQKIEVPNPLQEVILPAGDKS